MGKNRNEAYIIVREALVAQAQLALWTIYGARARVTVDNVSSHMRQDIKMCKLRQSKQITMNCVCTRGTSTNWTKYVALMLLTKLTQMLGKIKFKHLLYLR